MDMCFKIVNCIGRMYEYPDELGNIPIDVLWNLINMNVGACLTMTHIVMNGMKERKKGVIVNISSGSELQPLPYVTLYAATKVSFDLYMLWSCSLMANTYSFCQIANFTLKSLSYSQVFVRHFTLGLQTELAPYGISVQLLTPFCIQTKLHTYPVNVIVGNIFFPRVETFTKWAVFTLGKSTETTGYWAHAIMVRWYKNNFLAAICSTYFLKRMIFVPEWCNETVASLHSNVNYEHIGTKNSASASQGREKHKHRFGSNRWIANRFTCKNFNCIQPKKNRSIFESPISVKHVFIIYLADKQNLPIVNCFQLKLFNKVFFGFYFNSKLFPFSLPSLCSVWGWQTVEIGHLF